MRRSELTCLGIEGTAHTLGIGLASSSGEILADIRDSYVPPPGKGIHPREASQHHGEVVGDLLRKALADAVIEPARISLVAFSQGPGLGPCLRGAATTARALSVFLGVPLVGVNHVVAHIEIARLMTGASDPLLLILSGGTTQLVALEDRRYRIFGETLDITLANCIDVFAREAGLTDPGKPWLGPRFDEIASRGSRYVPLPYTVKGMDLQYSGLLSAAVRLHREARYSLEDLCFSLQETALSMVTEVAERALAHTQKPSLVLTGGFARNRRLQSMLSSMVSEHGASFHVCPHQYSADNGAMIAWTGILACKAGRTTPIHSSQVKPRWRVDTVPIEW